MNKIIQFGIPRTGSTLLYRVLKAIFNDVEKCHLSQVLPYLGKDYDIIVSIRHPIDSFISYIRVTEFPDKVNNIIINRNLIDKYITYYTSEHEQLMNIIKNYNNQLLILKYEKFYNNFNYIFNNLKSHLHIIISEEKEDEIKNTCSIIASKEIQSKLQTFKKYDKSSHIHGNHILNPKPLQSSSMISEENKKYLEKSFDKYIKYWSEL